MSLSRVTFSDRVAILKRMYSGANFVNIQRQKRPVWQYISIFVGNEAIGDFILIRGFIKLLRSEKLP